MKTREAKNKGEKERYTHLNAEFQRIARRQKKAFLSNQYKEIEENNRIGKTRNLFKKIRDTKGTFLAKMGTINHKTDPALLLSASLRPTYVTRTFQTREASDIGSPQQPSNSWRNLTAL